jgi:hypothetical protein
MIAFSRKGEHKKTITIHEKYGKHSNHPLFGFNHDGLATIERYNS